LPSLVSGPKGEEILSDYDETIGVARPAPAAPPPSAFTFHGTWTDFMRIAVPNLLLTVVTLGFYRFWATTRERNYLWGHTEFIDERLEWTGTGLELFIGFIMAFFLIGVPFALLQLVAQGLIFQGEPVIAGVLTLVLAFLLFYLIGVAYFRALRYRLSRTYWRGIRGGSDDQGLTYGLSYLWKNIAGAIPIYLLYPWATISLWNERWSKMSFGPYRFESNAQWTQLMKRYLLFYLAPFLLVVFAIYAGVTAAQGRDPGAADAAIMGGLGILMVFALYILLPVAALLYYSKFFRVAVAGLKIGELEFEFKARSPDWILFFLANWAIWAIATGLAFVPIIMVLGIGGSAGTFSPELFRNNMSATVIVTLGVSALIGVITIGLVNALIRYRSWKFFVVHMEAYGEVNLDRMSQSDTKSSGHGEGLLDAFDVGAI
jgi:uncharacterized membrane protein YjgN (DUF898 family)